MKIRTLLSLAFVAAGVFANADFNQIDNNATPNIYSANQFGVSQIFDQPNAGFNAMVLDEFTGNNSAVSQVEACFEFSRAAARGLVSAYRVSIFSSPAAAMGGGTALQPVGNSVDVSGARVTLNAVNSTSTATPTRVTLDLTGLGLNTGSGTRWLGVAAVLNPGTNTDQAWVLVHDNAGMAAVGGAVNNAMTVQPGDGFGFGGPTLSDDLGASNAAYSLTTVPEPASMVALGAGLLALARRRRNK